MHDLYQIFLRLLPVAMIRSSFGRVTKSQGERAILGVFLSIDNALQGVRCKKESFSISREWIMGVHSAGEM